MDANAIAKLRGLSDGDSVVILRGTEFTAIVDYCECAHAKIESLQAIVDDKNTQLEQLAEECSGWITQCQAVEAVVKQLPKCWRLNEAGERVQDVPVVPKGKVYGYMYGHIEAWRVRHITLTGSVHAELWEDPPIVTTRLASEFYSTEAAARAAKEGNDDE